MDESSPTQNRRTRRSYVLLSASIELSGASLPVKLRNLSSEGALIEGDKLPVEGSEVVFRKAELSVSGLAFSEPLHSDLVMRHIPTPRPRVQADFRRPGLSSRPLSAEDLRVGERWLPHSPFVGE
jgi:hypothetical protein